MGDLRMIPGLGKMDDYYDSDYVPHSLLIRCHALQMELRRRREQQVSAHPNTHSMAWAYDNSAAMLSSQVAVNGSPSTSNPNQRQQQAPVWGARSPHRTPQRSSGGLYKCPSGGDRGGISGGLNSHIPQPSMELEMVYAARQHSHISALNGGALSDDPVLTGPTAGCTAASFSLPSSATAAAPAVSAAASHSNVLSSNSPKNHCRREKQWRRPRDRAYNIVPMVSDPYGAAAEARRQEKFLSESKRLGKPFVPSGVSGLDAPTRFMLGDCVKALYRSIAPDWQMANLVVVSTAEDLLALYFSLSKLSKEQVTELLQYMNACLKYNVAIREFHLSKVDEGWDVLTNDEHILYTLRPPWVKKGAFLPDTVSPPHAHV